MKWEKQSNLEILRISSDVYISIFDNTASLWLDGKIQKTWSCDDCFGDLKEYVESRILVELKDLLQRNRTRCHLLTLAIENIAREQIEKQQIENSIERIAKVCHNVLIHFGDLPDWSNVSEERKDVSRRGVKFLIENPKATLVEFHFGLNGPYATRDISEEDKRMEAIFYTIVRELL